VSWDRSPARAWRRERDRLLAEWVAREVRPFSGFWGPRLESASITTAADLASLPAVEESELALAGGPGTPGLLLSPTEDGFKRHAPRAAVLAVAREVGRGGIDARRAALARRYRPVHVHEAGVAVLLAVASTRTDLDRLHLAGGRLAAVLGLSASDRLVSAVPAGPDPRFWALYHAALAAGITALHPVRSPASAVGALAAALAMLPASVLALPAPSALELLGGLAERRVRVERLRSLLVVGSPPPASARAALVEAAARLGARGVRVQAVWAPELSRPLWGECRPRDSDPDEAAYGLHTYPDLEVLSVRDPLRDAEVGEEVPGELVLTSLGWRGTALVRCATGAWTGGLVDSVPCPNCQRTVPRLAPAAVDGAFQPRVRGRDGRLQRLDLHRAAPALGAEALARAGAQAWALHADGDVLVLSLDGPTSGTRPVVDLARRVGAAVGVVPQVRLGGVVPDAAGLRG